MSNTPEENVLPGVTEGALIEAMENPEVFAEIARGDLYVQMARMRELSKNPEMPATQRMEYAKFLAKMGKVENPDKGGDNLSNLPGINIIFPSNGDQSVKITSVPLPRVEKEVNPPVSDQEVEEMDTGFGSGTGKPSKAVIP